MSYSVRDYTYFNTIQQWSVSIDAYFGRHFTDYRFLPVRIGSVAAGIWTSPDPIPTPKQSLVQATALAIVDAFGRISGVTITNPGSGYILPPIVSLIPPLLPSTPATFGQVAVGGGGVLFELVPFIPNGFGYFAGPYTVIIDPPPGPGIQATATVTVSGGSVQTFTFTDPGSGYVGVPNIVVSPGPLPSVLAAFTATLSAGTVSSIVVDNPGQNYNPFASPLVLTVGGPP